MFHHVPSTHWILAFLTSPAPGAIWFSLGPRTTRRRQNPCLWGQSKPVARGPPTWTVETIGSSWTWSKTPHFHSLLWVGCPRRSPGFMFNRQSFEGLLCLSLPGAWFIIHQNLWILPKNGTGPSWRWFHRSCPKCERAAKSDGQGQPARLKLIYRPTELVRYMEVSWKGGYPSIDGSFHGNPKKNGWQLGVPQWLKKPP